MSPRDCRQSLSTFRPRPKFIYRVGNNSLGLYYQTTFVSVTALLIGLLVLITINPTTRCAQKFISYGLSNSYIDMDNYLSQTKDRIEEIINHEGLYECYNATYPLTPPVHTAGGIKYRIAIISDLDSDSKSKHELNTWISYLKKGYLIWHPHTNLIEVTWDRTDPICLKSNYGTSGQGMELSELVVFNGILLSFDDRTGIIYKINPEGCSAIPWVLLVDGNGLTSKGFKSEWASVKEHRLYVGSMGKEWTTSGGELVNHNPMWIKTVTPAGQVGHLDWEVQYKTLQRAVGVEFPGYMIHESGVWSDIHQRWFFLPRRLSKSRYNDETDEYMSTNILLSTDQHFNNVEVTYIGETIPTHGFASFKFLPGTDDSVIVALKSEEEKGRSATYIIAFHIDGKILLPETKVADLKYEGIEFI